MKPLKASIHAVVIVGGGFGGLAAAKALRQTPVLVTLVDRTNHHLFQPLLYQVAMAGPSPADIAAPIRSILNTQRNVTVLLGEATGIDFERRILRLRDGELPFDDLLLGTGGRTSYFGHDEWSKFAPGLKSLDDAIEIRCRVLLAFEAAEREEPEKVSTLGFRKSIQDLVQSITQYAAKHAIATPGIQRTDLPKDSIRELEPAAPSIVAFRNAISKQTIVVARRAMACERSGGGKENSKPTVARQDMD